MGFVGLYVDRMLIKREEVKNDSIQIPVQSQVATLAQCQSVGAL